MPAGPAAAQDSSTGVQSFHDASVSSPRMKSVPSPIIASSTSRS